MPRSSGPEMPQRRSPRGPSQLRTSSSDSDPLHHRPTTDRSPKLGVDRRSPRGPQTDPVNQKKLGTRIADLESQLGQAQEELKCLKEQLASAEAAKKAAQEQLEKKSKKPIAPEPVEIQEKNSSQMQKNQELKSENNSSAHEISEENLKETDVFEVPVEKATVEPRPKLELDQAANEDELKTKSANLKIEPPAILEPEKPSFDELALNNDEINSLRAKLEEKEKELGGLFQENESLKTQLNEKSSEISAAQSKENEMNSRLNQVTKELEESKNSAVQINEKLEASEKAREELEAEMKRLRVQTEQWRKAADAAAAVLAGGVEMKGRRISERCGSMDKHFGTVFEAPSGGYHGYLGSPGVAEDSDDVYGSGKRKGSGIRMFGDLWKKKGQK